MIGLLRGSLPEPGDSLLAIRRVTEAKGNLEGYTSPGGPILRNAISALEARAAFEEFLPVATQLVAIELSSLGDFPGASTGWRAAPQAASQLLQIVRGHASIVLESSSAGGQVTDSVLVLPPNAPALGKELLSLARVLPLEAGVEALLPRDEDLRDLRLEKVAAIAKVRRTGPSEGVTGLVRMAASAAQAPSVAGAALIVSITRGAPGMDLSAGCRWVNYAEARRLYEAGSKEILIEAARKAAIRDTRVEPPSHECFPEIYSLLLPPSRQFIVDDETDELAMEFLLGPLGLLKAEPQHGADTVRPLSEVEVASIKARLEALNALSEHELFSEAGRFLRPGVGSSDDGGYAGELAGDLRERMDKLFASAAKKREPITLVTCSDWLGSGKG